MREITRRRLLASGAGLALAVKLQPIIAAHAEGLEMGPAEPFDFQQLKSLARSLAALPHVEPPLTHEGFVRNLDVHHHNRIRFKPEYALWQDSLFPMRLHHRGHWFPYFVKIHVVQGGEARQLLFTPDAFDYSELDL